MPARNKVTLSIAETTLSAYRPAPPTTEQHITNRIRISNNVSLNVGRKLLKAALKANKLSLHIGVEPETSDTEQAEAESDEQNPFSPNYYYYGRDINKLKQLLVSNHIMLNCSATVSYGDGGYDISNDEEAEYALSLIKDDYREPELILYF